MAAFDLVPLFQARSRALGDIANALAETCTIKMPARAQLPVQAFRIIDIDQAAAEPDNSTVIADFPGFGGSDTPDSGRTAL